MTLREMEEMPDDVRTAANAEASRWFQAIGGASYHFADAIARAILAERERSAGLVEARLGDIDPELAEFAARLIRGQAP